MKLFPLRSFDIQFRTFLVETIRHFLLLINTTFELPTIATTLNFLKLQAHTDLPSHTSV